jgi:hypothetical protein
MAAIVKPLAPMRDKVERNESGGKLSSVDREFSSSHP